MVETAVAQCFKFWRFVENKL